MAINQLRIVAIHGNGGGGFRFQWVYQYIPLGVKLQTVTLPGFAGVPADPNLQTMRDFADYLYGVITEGRRPVVALGTGTGGSMLLEYAQHYPETLNGMILHTPVGTGLDTRQFPRLMRLPGMRRTGRKVFSSRIARPVFQRLVFNDNQELPPAYVNHFFDAYGQCTVFDQMFDLITPDWYASLKPINVPTALLWGENDRVLNVNQIRDYQRLLRNNVVRIVPGWDHFPMIEQPEAYARELISLAKRVIEQGAAKNEMNRQHQPQNGKAKQKNRKQRVNAK
ncbi:MAG TPA: alpha/beta hydrolase [Phototrophicaceae bacterium]|nr:alpha/beta hydrolase [Phototrophicaceae bacterium]